VITVRLSDAFTPCFDLTSIHSAFLLDSNVYPRGPVFRVALTAAE